MSHYQKVIEARHPKISPLVSSFCSKNPFSQPSIEAKIDRDLRIINHLRYYFLPEAKASLFFDPQFPLRLGGLVVKMGEADGLLASESEAFKNADSKCFMQIFLQDR